MKNNIKFEKLSGGGGYSLKKVLLISIVVIVLTLILLKNFSHAAFTSRKDVPLANGKINYKHPDFKIVAMFQKNTAGTYTEVNTMPSGSEYKINESKSYCNKGFTEEKDTNAVLKTVDGNHVMNNLTKNDRCTVYFDPLPILSQKWFDKQDTENVITKRDVESITTLNKISIPENAKSWDASEKSNGSVIAYYTDTDNNGKYELYLAGDSGVIASKDSSKLFGDTFNGFSNVINIDLNFLDTTNVTNMSNMFENMSSLTNLNIRNFNTSKVTNMRSMFENVSSLTILDLNHFDISKVTDMDSIFSGMSKLTNLNISNFDTSKITNMSCMFRNVKSLASLDISNFDTSNVTDMSYMFLGMNNLSSLDISNFDTSKVSSMRSMFSNSNIKNLDLNNFNTSKVTNMSYMFSFMSNLTNLNLSTFDFSNVTSYDSIFYYNSNLNTIKVKDATAKTFIDATLANAKITGVTVTSVS